LSSNQSQIVFFLGAGASVAAGVPDTHGIVDEFRKHNRKHYRDWPDRHRTIEKIIEILQKNRKELGLDKRVDVELLLETLERLDRREQELVLWFYKLDEYMLADFPEKRPLIVELKEFIKGKAIVEADRIRYLEPLLAFIEEHKPLDILSVNYDTCIEQFCIAYKKSCQDGFDIYWNPETFKRDTDVRLYKLHGSVTWYRSDRGNYLKIPILSEESRVRLFTKETAESLILYPVQKWEYAEPMLDLLVDLKRKLENASYVFVVGYTFRDEHIRRMFWDAANRNNRLVLFLIGPNANEVFNRRLRFYDIGSSGGTLQIPSSLDARVICLPYKFEDVLPKLKNYYLHHLKTGQSEEKTSRDAEIQGRPTNWSSSLGPYVECEYISKATQVLEKVDWQKLDWLRGLEISFKMMINAIIHGDRESAQNWRQKFIDATPWFSLEKFKFQSETSLRRFRLEIQLSEHTSLNADHIANSLVPLTTFVEIRTSIAAMEEAKQRMRLILDGLLDLSRYMSSWKGAGMEYSTYVENRKEAYKSQIEALEKIFDDVSKGQRWTNDLSLQADTAVEDIEKVELQKRLEQIKKTISID